MQTPTVVVVEDDPTNRMLISQILRKHEFEVLPAANGALGLELITELLPDVVVTDIQMPEMDGVALLSALRKNPNTATIPVLMLTSLAERSSMRQSMAAGADDYITKPFSPAELVEAVRAQIKKRQMHVEVSAQATRQAISTALEDQKHKIAGVYERRLKKELAETLWNHNLPEAKDESFAEATLLFADLVSPDWPRRLAPAELAEALKLSYSNATDTLSLFGAHTVQMVGEGLLAVFVPTNDTQSVGHATRALKSAFALASAAERVNQHLAGRLPDAEFPPFDMAVALYRGAVAIASMQTAEAAATRHGVPVGESVKAVMRLQAHAVQSRCKVLATQAWADGIGARVSLGRKGEADVLSNGQAVPIVEILNWRPGAATGG